MKEFGKEWYKNYYSIQTMHHKGNMPVWEMAKYYGTTTKQLKKVMNSMNIPIRKRIT